jgi:hypothetical protein
MAALKRTDPKLRLAAALWLLAMSGVVVLAFTVLPQLVAKAHGTVPLGVVMAANVVQGGVLLLLAVWSGVALARPLGLGAPAIEAALSGSGGWPALKRQLLPAAITGLLVGATLALAPRIAPAALLAANASVELPLAAKLLYGGVTEEVLMRWGLMTFLIWLPWRLLQKKTGLPRAVYVIVAILFAAVLFGVLHLPAAAAMGIPLTAPVVTFIIIGNCFPGILFGFLYWRHGIEASIIAHALGHLVGFLVTTI